jgi:hypothetical protein
MNKTVIDTFLAARRVSTPLLMIRTPDPIATVKTITAAVKQIDDAKKTKTKTQVDSPVIFWDCINGWQGINDSGREAVNAAMDGAKPKDVTANAVESLELAVKLPAKCILFLSNAHAGFDPPNPNYIQAISNLREKYKTNQRQLVLLTPGCTLPPELAQDVLTLDEPLPTADQLEEIVTKLYRDALEDSKAKLDKEVMTKAVDALCGLAAFPADQVTAMSLKRNSDDSIGFDLQALWDRKRQIVEGTPGLTVYRGTERFSDIGGLDNIKEFLTRFINGKRPPRVVLFMDEIEKMLGGSDGDTSGTSQSILAKWLSWTQDKNANGQVKSNGMLLLGHPGVGKSILAKATGNEAGVPTVIADLGSVKSSLVGSSEARMDNMLKVVDAIGQGEILMLVTCNKIDSLKPEFRSRFQLGTWMFSLPTPEERKTIWGLHRKRFGIDPADKIPPDDGWVGREIEACCQMSYLLDIPLQEASAYITPSVVANSEAINALNQKANGRYLSATYPGIFKHSAATAAEGAGRAIDLE